MKQSYQTNVRFSSLEDAKAIADDYRENVFAPGNGVGANAGNLEKLRETRKWYGFNSKRFAAVTGCIAMVEQLKDERISPEHPEVYENLLAAYADLCRACSTYIDYSDRQYTATGKKRMEIIKEVYENAEKEILMIQMKYFELEGKFTGEGASIRQLLSGELMPQRIRDDAADFSLEEMESVLSEGAAKYALQTSAAGFKASIQKEGRVNVKDSSVIAILLEYYQRILGRLDTDPASENLIPDILHRIIALCQGQEKSNVLAALSRDAERVLAETGITAAPSSEGMMNQGFRTFAKVKDEELAQAEQEASDDQFSDYPVLTSQEVKEMAEQNDYNKGEAAKKLYGLQSREGAKYGYMQTGNSFNINKYQRSRRFEDVKYQSHATIGMMDRATVQNRLSHKARFYRVLGGDYLRYALGLRQENDQTFDRGAVQAVNAMAGKVITDAGYMCVGYQLDTIFAAHPIMLTLLCDEGMPLMATTNYDEGEMVFPRNTSYMIIGARKREGGTEAGAHERVIVGSSKNETHAKGFFRGLEIICKVLNPANQEGQEGHSVESMAAFKRKQISYAGSRGSHGDGVHRSAYLEMAQHDFESLTEAEKAAMNRYTTDSGDINRRLRSGEDVSDALQEDIGNIKGAMKKHPLPTDLTTYRGVDDGMLIFLMNTSPDIPPEAAGRYIVDGKIDHNALYRDEGYKLFEGIIFKDPAFVSTSTNRFFAKRWSNMLNHKAAARQMQSEAEKLPRGSQERRELSSAAHREEYAESDITGSHVMNMHLKKGTRALFSDTMYTETGRPRGQDEVTLDSGGTYRITAAKAEAPGQYVFEVELL